MATGLEIISRALKDIGALEAGETPTPEAAQDAFEMLNDLIDQSSYSPNSFEAPLTDAPSDGSSYLRKDGAWVTDVDGGTY